LSNNLETIIAEIIRHANDFKHEAEAVLATHESSRTRVIVVEDTYEQIKNLSIKQDDLFRQSLRCVQQSIFRAAYVLAWAAFMDFLEEELSKDQFVRLNALGQNWNVNSIDDLRDIGSDFQIIEAIRKIGLCSKSDEKALKGLLTRRNECAHPTDYYPGINDTLGYISEILQRLDRFKQRWK
jgi:hypothetical protein